MTLNASIIAPEKRVELATTGQVKISRNDPCPCGSGNKFKKCCLGTRTRSAWVTSKTTTAPVINSYVPCDGCTRCCHNDAIRLLPGDDPGQYVTVPHPYFTGELMLDHKPNGDCIYLGDSRCEIHSRRPQMCREMDCRTIANKIPLLVAQKLNSMGKFRMDVWQRGIDLMKEFT
jgi:hypothetical protein